MRRKGKEKKVLDWKLGRICISQAANLDCTRQFCARATEVQPRDCGAGARTNKVKVLDALAAVSKPFAGAGTISSETSFSDRHGSGNESHFLR